MTTYSPDLDPRVSKLMLDIGHVIKGALNKTVGGQKMGFALMMFELGDGGRMNYVSSARREDMIVALKELVARMEGMDVTVPETKQ